MMNELTLWEWLFAYYLFHKQVMLYREKQEKMILEGFEKDVGRTWEIHPWMFVKKPETKFIVQS